MLKRKDKKQKKLSVSDLKPRKMLAVNAKRPKPLREPD